MPQCQQCELKHPDPKRKTNVKNIKDREDEIFCRNVVSFETNIDQTKDQVLSKIIKLLKAGEVDVEEPDEIQDLGPEAASLWRKRSKLRLRGGILYLLDSESQYRLLVPKDDRKELIKMTHENFTHIGARKTLNLHVLTEKYYWVNIDLDVRLCIGKCTSVDPVLKGKVGPTGSIIMKLCNQAIHSKKYLWMLRGRCQVGVMVKNIS